MMLFSFLMRGTNQKGCVCIRRGKGVKKAKWNGVAEKKKKGRKKREGRGGGDGSGFTIFRFKTAKASGTFVCF